jgi:FkbM family methyltransferase
MLRRRAVNAVRRRLARPTPLREVELAEWAFYLDYLKPGMIAFDVGAYLGEVTLLFSKLVGPTGRVHSFEPVDTTFRRLVSNIAGFGRTNVDLNLAAVSNVCGPAMIYLFGPDSLSWSSLADRPLEDYGIPASSRTIQQTSTVTIDSYCRDHAIDSIDLLKVDVEGAELEVLRGADELLRSRRIGCCAFEFGQTTFDLGHDPLEITHYLKAVGYDVRNVVAGDRVFPGGDRRTTAQFSMHLAMPE